LDDYLKSVEDLVIERAVVYYWKEITIFKEMNSFGRVS
jgi:hypothetical protein